MFLNYTPQTLGLPVLPMAERLPFARACGFQGSDLWLDELSSADDARRARDLAAELGMRWGLFSAPLQLDMPDAAFEEGLKMLQAKAPWLVTAGCTRTYNHVWSGHHALAYAENFKLHQQRLARIATLCHDLGLLFGLEFLGPLTLQQQFAHPFIRNIEPILALIDNRPGLGLVIDSFHLYTSGGQIADLDVVPDSLPIVNVHLNDARADRTREEQLDMERAMPGETGVIDTVALMKWLAQRGYDGPIIAEPFEPARSRLAAMGNESAAKSVAQNLQALLRRVGIAA